MTAAAVCFAAGVGAVCRYLLDVAVRHRVRTPFPVGTLLVNVSGSLLLGLVTGLALHHSLAATPAAVVGVGFAGGFTTLSTWAWESLALAEEGELALAALNVVGSLLLGLLAAAAGLGLAHL